MSTGNNRKVSRNLFGANPSPSLESQESYPPISEHRNVHPSEPFSRWSSSGRRSSTSSSTYSPSFLQRLGAAFGSLRLSVSYTTADIARRPRNFCIGVWAVVFLVLFTSVLIMAIEKAPYIFLRLAELTSGEADIVLMGDRNNIQLLDYVSMEPRLLECPEIRGIAPRWVASATAQNYSSFNNNRSSKGDRQRASPTASVKLLIIDSELERRIGIGRGWKHRDIHYAETHVFRGVLDYLGVQANRGGRIDIQIPLSGLFLSGGVGNGTCLQGLMESRGITDANPLMRAFLTAMNITNSSSLNLLNLCDVDIVADVVDGFTSTNGKYPTSFGNVVMMDYKKLLPVFLEQHLKSGLESTAVAKVLPSSLLGNASRIISLLNSSALLSYVPFISIVLNDRRSMYYKGAPERSKEMTLRSNSIAHHALGGHFNGQVDFPLMRALEVSDANQSVLVSFLTTTVFGTIVLSAMLFFMLLQIGSDERRFEFAMLRVQGLEKCRIVALIMSQTIAFIIPGVILGLVLIVIVNFVFEGVLTEFTVASPRYDVFSIASLAVALSLGIVLPLFASWGAVSRAFGSSLHGALDASRSVQSETKVVMIRLEELGVAAWQTLLGLFLVGAGFLVYYMIPFSFIFGHMSIFFILMNFILIAMVVGICLTMHVIAPYVESATLWLILWGREKQFMMIVKKNLYDHRARNSKTFMMILLSISSIVSGSVAFSMLSMSSAQLIEIFNGADIVATSAAFRLPLDEKRLTPLLQKWHGECVQDWAYHSFPLHHYPQIEGPTRLRTTISVSVDMPIIAVSENLLDTVFPDYVMEEARDVSYPFTHTVDGKYDVVRSMYDHPPHPAPGAERIIATGSDVWARKSNVSEKLAYVVPAIAAAGLQDYVGVNIGDGMTLRYKYMIGDSAVHTQFYVSLRAFMKRLSGFPSITPLTGSGIVLIPQSFFATLLNPIALDFKKDAGTIISPGAVTEVRQQKLFLRLREDITTEERSVFVNELLSVMDLTDHTVHVTQEALDELSITSRFIMILFYFTAIISVTLCTLMMWITFVANVQLNVRVVGVLRALGCHNRHVFRIILYEAFSVVLSAFFIGLLVGSLLGLILGLQLASIMILPFKFTMPYVLIGLLFGLSILAAVLGSLFPFRAVNKLGISVLLKGK